MTTDFNSAGAVAPSVVNRRNVALRKETRRERRQLDVLAGLWILAGSVGLYLASPDVRVVLMPGFVVTVITLLYVAVLLRRERHLPLFEVATLFVITVTVYTVVPLVQFVLGGLEVTPWSDNRLYQWQPTPQEFGGFAWRHVIFLGAFVLTYLPVRGRRLWPIRTPVRPMPTTTSVIFVTAIAITLWYFSLNLYLGPGESVYRGGTGTSARSVPHIVLQIANVMQTVCFTLKQCLIVMLLLGWYRRSYRYALIAWMAAEIAITLFAMESRASMMLFLLTVGVGYHHLVRPLRLKLALAGGLLVLGGFLLFGFLRDMRAVDESASNERYSVFSVATEFQVVYGTAYDLQMRKDSGTLPPVPTQLYFSDFYRLIPRQLLPFYKWDPADWYLDVLGILGSGQGYMFGVIAQSVIGYGIPELIVRGFFLALFYALAHRVYSRYSKSFWITIGYLFILSWSYYSFRSTSFDILYRLVYYFIPTWLIVKVLTIVVTKAKLPARRIRYA